MMLIAACGHGSGQRGTDGGGGGQGGDARGGGDANGSAIDAAGGDAMGGGDGGVVTGCAQPGAPSSVTTMSSVSDLNFIDLFSAGGKVFATLPLSDGSSWLRWTGTAWSQEAIPWPAALPAPHSVDHVVQLASGDALIVSRTYLMTFDGTTMTAPVALPAIDTPWAYAQGPDGAYHVFADAQESVSKPDGTWYPAAPVPVQKLSLAPTAVATVMASGRVVVVYIDQTFGSTDPVHVHVVSRVPGGTWTADDDITPTWAVRAQDPIVFAPPGGGVAIGASAPGVGGAAWRSSDGTTFGDYEALGISDVASIAGPCLDALVAAVGYQTRYDLMKLDGTSWEILDSQTVNYIDSAAAAMLPDGRTFWALGESSRVEYRATP